MAKARKKKYEHLPIANTEIRVLMAQRGIRHKEIAEKINVSQNTLSQWFRYEMRKWQYVEVLRAIAEITAERGNNENENEKDYIYQ